MPCIKALNIAVRGADMNIKPLSDLKAFLENYAAPMGIEIVDVEFSDKDRAITIFIET